MTPADRLSDMFDFGMIVRIQEPHPLAGMTGEVFHVNEGDDYNEPFCVIGLRARRENVMVPIADLRIEPDSVPMTAAEWRAAQGFGVERRERRAA